jgi:nitrite reductase (NADH) small subunit
MTKSEGVWRKVTGAENIPVREGRCVEIASRQIAIFHTREGFVAVENRCPHRGGPLADGIVNGATVVCPLHAWQFDLRSGVSTNHPEASSGLTTYATRVEDGNYRHGVRTSRPPYSLGTSPAFAFDAQRTFGGGTLAIGGKPANNGESTR